MHLIHSVLRKKRNEENNSTVNKKKTYGQAI